MYCSIIIPTVGRSSLTRAVVSVLQQRIPEEDFEVIVVNDSGNPLPEADWQRSERVQIIDTNRRERSVARNTGAAAAKGKYVHFLDDDDWLFPGAYQHLWKLSRSSDAKWLYGMTQLVDRQDRPSIQLRHGLHGNCLVQAMAGEWIPLQSSWIERKTFMRIGGFNPLLAGPEDIDLLRRILLEEDVAETSNLIAQVIMGGEGSTTDYAHHSEASRWAREHILHASGVHDRMLLSAISPLWKGRMLRVYLTSVIWNLRQRQFFIALSRIHSSLISLLQSGMSLFSKQFWSAVTKPYASLTFERGLREIKKASSLEV
jgi:glycosyltransferase involved in cell wall biosynthesis